MKPATIYDVARRAGVSHQTVSRFLAGFEGIRPETRARVEAAIGELQYRPNTAARSLRLRRSTRIAVLADRIDQTGPARVIAGATQTAQSLGYFVDAISTEGFDTDTLDETLDQLRTGQVLGVLATAPTKTVVRMLDRLASDVPVVVDSQELMSDDGVPFDEVAGRVAADHLLDLGHRQLGYLGGPPSWIASADRERGFRDRVAQRGGRLVAIEHGDWWAASGHAAWEALDPRRTGITAVATANDSMAVGLIAAATSAGIAIPADFSVLGTDDFPEAAFLNPPLSTVALDFEGTGRHLVRTLLAKLGETVQTGDPLRQPHVVPRASTSAPRGR